MKIKTRALGLSDTCAEDSGERQGDGLDLKSKINDCVNADESRSRDCDTWDDVVAPQRGAFESTDYQENSAEDEH
jgi:hypothetical protein